MWKQRLVGFACLLAIPFGRAAAEEPHVPPVTAYVEAHVRPWATDPVIIAAVKAQNARSAKLDRASIESLDQTWRAELGSDAHPMMDEVLSNPLSAFLHRMQDASDGSITEIFVMDASGLNVGQSDITSDYWQGDEAKFIEGWRARDGRVFVDIAEKDESTQMVQSQASFAIVDEAGTPIGVITVGINLDQL